MLDAAQLDQIVAPIALYPDTVLAQVLMASTYPLEVVQATRWQSANKSLKGDKLDEAVAKQDWDASVKALDEALAKGWTVVDMKNLEDDLSAAESGAVRRCHAEPGGGEHAEKADDCIGRV